EGDRRGGARLRGARLQAFPEQGGALRGDRAAWLPRRSGARAHRQPHRLDGDAGRHGPRHAAPFHPRGEPGRRARDAPAPDGQQLPRGRRVRPPRLRLGARAHLSQDRRVPARRRGGGRPRRDGGAAGEPLLVRPARRRHARLCAAARAQRRALSRRRRPRSHRPGGVVHPARLRPHRRGDRRQSAAAARRARRCPAARSRRRVMDGRTAALERADATANGAVRRGVPSRRKLVWRLVIMALLLLVVFGGLYGYERFRAFKTAEFFANNKPPPTAIVAVAEAAEPVPQSFTAIGSLVAVHQVAVSPEVTGRVTKIFFESGATVHAGDPLAQLNLARAKELASRQNGPRANVDTYQSQLDQANAGIAKTQALIAQKLVRAPFAGVLGIRQVDLGQYVTTGAPLVTLTDLDTLYANFTLPEQNRAALSVGQNIEVTVDAYPGRRFPAKLTTIEPQVGAETRTIKLQATLANPERLLMPGMFANARVVLPSLPDVVTVPETAVEYTLYGDSVFVVGEDAAAQHDGKPVLRVKRTFVKTGERFDNKVAILSGLKAGERVATSGQIKLNDGAAVTLTTSDALATPDKVPTN